MGHTDGSGSAGHNERLALARATHVRALLIALGAAPERVLLRSAAAREPLADDRTEEGRALNRRVEVRAVEWGLGNNVPGWTHMPLLQADVNLMHLTV